MNHEPDSPVVPQQDRRGAVLAVFWGFWTATRFALYMLLMVVRIPVQLLGHLLFLPLVAAGVFWGLVYGWKSPAFIWLTGVGVSLWVFSFLFDTLLLWVAPEDLYLWT